MRLVEIADSLGNDAELARIAQVSRAAVSQWRAGDVKTLKALSALNIQEKTGYSARWLVLGIGPKKMVNKSDAGVLAKHDGNSQLSPRNERVLLAILRAFFEADDEGKQEIAAAVEAANGDAKVARQGQQQQQPRRGSPAR